MGALDPEVIEEADHVKRHVLEGVARRALVALQQLPGRRDGKVVERGRTPDVAIVEADHEEAGRREALTELIPPRDHLRPEPHDQHERGIGTVAERLVTELQLTDRGDLLARSKSGACGIAHAR